MGKRDEILIGCIRSVKEIKPKIQIEVRLIDYDNSDNFQGIPTQVKQIEKCREEDEEFYQEIIKGNLDNALQEFHDTFMSKCNLLQQLGIPPHALASIIAESQPEHFDKLVKRGVTFF